METLTSYTTVVVNDDPIQLRRTSGLLEKDGLSVVSFSGAVEALSAMDSTNPPDIIITDLHMPVIDGWRFCRLLRSPEYEAFNNVPILVISATFSGTHAQRLTTDLGANAFLPSPYEPSVLRSQVRALLAGKVYQQTPKVLIIEDNRTLVELLTGIFEKHGYSVHSAVTGKEGKELYKKVNPNIVILDYHLPDINGDHLLKEFKKPESFSVVLMITADPTPELATVFMKMGADGYIRKPFDPHYLITLCEMTSRERALLRVEDVLEERTQELQKSEERFRSFFEVISEIVIIYDERGNILQINDAGADSLEWDKNDLVGENLEKIVTKENVGKIIKNIQQTFTEGYTRFEMSYLTKSGSVIDAEISEKPIKYDKKPAILCISRDITERKKTEIERLKREKLQGAIEMAGAACHELNQPLQVISG
ncbi:MAG TPA: response regulator, partial [Anaerolineae bacterium]|nr:response regulator [Anaerolineae bacterium]